MRCLVLLGGLLSVLPLDARAQTAPSNATAPAGDPAMDKAVAQARATLPPFLDLSRHPKPGMERFAVKVALGVAGAREYFWLDPFIEADGQVTGALANEPAIVQGYRLGQAVSVPLSEIVDWRYVENGRMRGNYTACAILAKEGPDALPRLDQANGADCKAF